LVLVSVLEEAGLPLGLAALLVHVDVDEAEEGIQTLNELLLNALSPLLLLLLDEVPVVLLAELVLSLDGTLPVSNSKSTGVILLSPLLFCVRDRAACRV